MTNRSRLLGTYRLATRLMEPLAPRLLARRQARGKEDPARVGERLGIAGRPRPRGPLVWMHGASVGEGLALLPLIPPLVERRLHVLITTGTATSARLLSDRLPPGAMHQFVPVDGARCMQRFLGHWQPALAMIAESELWPNMICETHARGIPIVLVNARMSARSASRWMRAKGFIAAMLGRIDLCLAQELADADRFRALGAATVRVAGNLKYDTPVPAADHDQLSQLSAVIGTRPTWVAASTHAGEEDIAADVHIALARRFPGLLTILAPRHPHRGGEVMAMLRARGLATAVRSRGEPPRPPTQIYLVDTIGDLGTIFRLASVVFTGKSLAGAGGQNPIEAARLGAVILHGPNVQNFEEAYRLLDEAKAAIEVADAAALREALAALLADPARTRAMARAASEAMEGQAGVVHRTLQAIEPYIGMGTARAGD